jgi:hypothetical protein
MTTLQKGQKTRKAKAAQLKAKARQTDAKTRELAVRADRASQWLQKVAKEAG